MRYIEGAVSYGWQGHQKHQDEDDQPSRQRLRQRPTQSTRLQLFVEPRLLHIGRVFGLLAKQRFLLLRARLDHIFVQLNDSDQSYQSQCLDNLPNLV